MGLRDKIIKRDLTFGVIGLGYVGLPLAANFAAAGFNVIGIDISKDKVEKINSGINYIQDVDDEELRHLVQTGKLQATADYCAITEIDAVSICVPTPLNKLKDPDVSYILEAVHALSQNIHPGMVIVLESTTYPGTTRELILPELEKSGLKVGEDFYLSFSPERVDPGNAVYKTRNTPKVIGGVTPACTAMGKLLYEQVIETVVPVSTPEAAELVKLLENTFRSINIGLVNEMAIMAEKLGVDIWEVIDAADTKPFGFMKFYPGPGLGGHCIPIDPNYLAWKMKTLDYKARFIELAGEINTGMPYHILQLVMDGLNRQKKCLNGSTILLIGVAYKKDIDDVRESPALDILRLLKQHGAKVKYYDPYVSRLRLDGEIIFSIEDLGSALDAVDGCIIATDHSDIDYQHVVESARLVIDSRNVVTAKNGSLPDHVIKLGNGKIQVPKQETREEVYQEFDYDAGIIGYQA